MIQENKYATVTWTAEDVLTLRPQWSKERAEEWLEANQKYVRDRLVELGWDVIETLLSSEGRDE